MGDPGGKHMDNFVESMLKEFEGGKMSRRQLIQTIAIAATAFAAGEATLAEAAPATTLGFHTIGVNHISYSVTGKDYGVARDFYVKNFGFDYVPAQDSGSQCYLPFGPRDNGTFMLPRGGRDPNAGPAPERGAGGGGGGRGAAGARGAAGGRGGGAGGDAPAGAAGNRGGGGNAAPQPTTLLVDQFGLTISNFDAKKTEEALKRAGLDPKKDGESFHVVDPFGMELVVASTKMSAY
jgi:hypothetical protein